ncbi:hypothetical protein Achl_2106 [Pseudarthrobacter chlorophenolicus A6]|uniref:Integral membrane protein n=1 Tax=Pseudarthrobacter chlorophenolicus (strain ATCC 700700 / DSM 12829 / CIP 107037 / JCM 12360 / KCTC 9906 / NCIMB 13794 / A6) TaxID=452863 RepID=B8H9K6_PSECP|nr:hypothetical protein Achl_2106 [Pseudarthrobacter chlorophenolicus A6]SDQ88287.1 hypothetical protein SAMN04489738_3393 [Pseudarthrobacter chlorophenolicus]
MNRRKAPSWPRTEVWAWVVGIVVVTLFVLPWSLMEVGRCVDYIPGFGESFCESGPVIGQPAAAIVGAASALMILYFLYRIARIVLQRRASRRIQDR